MLTIKLTILTAILLPAVSLFTLSLGEILTARFFVTRFTRHERYLLSYFLGIAATALIYLIPALLGVSGSALQLLLIVTVLLVLWQSRRSFSTYLRESDLRFALLLQWLFCIAIIFSASLISGIGYVDPVSLMNFTGLPIDLLIPFNTARFFLEGIPFASEEVVPGWMATDRGPLSALVISFFVSLAGIHELGGWLYPDPLAYTLSYVVLAYLNSSAIVLLYLLLAPYSRKAASLSLIFLFSSYFFILNVLFPWPKFMAAAFFIFAAFLVLKKNNFIGGVLFAFAMLSHESVVFAFVMMLLLLLIRGVVEKTKFTTKLISVVVDLAKLLGGFFLVYSPWLVTKQLFGPEKPTLLLYFHLFCDKDGLMQSMSLLNAFALYLEQNSIAEVLTIRFENLLYPFNILHPWPEVVRYWHSPGVLIRSISQLSFYQFIFAVGIPLFIKALLSLKSLSKKKREELAPLFIVSILAVVPAAVLFGCPLSSWAHHWAYPAILATVMVAAFTSSKYSLVNFGLILLALVNNFSFFYSEFYHKRLLLEVGDAALLLQCSLLLAPFVLVTVNYLMSENNDH